MLEGNRWKEKTRGRPEWPLTKPAGAVFYRLTPRRASP
jgi:hypothetical protein